ENTAPVAVPDAYTVNQNSTLSVPAPGVLANDIDEDGDHLTAILVSGPAHAAAFQFNADGSFTYTPQSGFLGTDVFTYKPNDGRAASNVTTVTITHNRPAPTHIFVVGPDKGFPTLVRVFDAQTRQELFNFTAFPGLFVGVRVAVGDVNGDGVPDIIVGTGRHGASLVRVFDGLAHQPVAGRLGLFPAFFRGSGA